MRDSCNAFQKAQILKPYVKKCPEVETPLIRPLSGHGVKVCEPCRKKNRSEQRQRENAQKRARRAKLKRDRMTAGIGAGNVVWTTPNAWRPSVVDAQILALHSPQPRRLNTFKIATTMQAIEYGLDGSTGMATMTQNLVDVSQHDREVYSQSRQAFAATTSCTLPSKGKDDDTFANDVADDAILDHQLGSELQNLPTTLLDNSVCQERNGKDVGLGITLANYPKWYTEHTKICSFNKCSFQMEFKEWSTAFEDGDDPDYAQDLCR